MSDIKINDTKLGDYIKQVLKEKGWSLRKAALNIGVSPAYLSKLTNHKADSEPKPYTLRKIANGLNIDYSEIESIVHFKISGDAQQSHDLADVLDNHEYMTYQGKPIDDEDLELIKRILRNK